MAATEVTADFEMAATAVPMTAATGAMEGVATKATANLGMTATAVPLMAATEAMADFGLAT